MEIETAIKRAVLAELGPHPTPSRRRELARVLVDLAAEQEAVADAQDRQARLPADQRVTPRKMGAGPGRAPGAFVRIETQPTRTGGSRLMVYLGRQLFYELGSPRRVDVVRQGRMPAIIVAEGGTGYAVQAQAGHMPHFTCDSARDILGLDDGRYAGIVDGQTLTIVGPWDG